VKNNKVSSTLLRPHRKNCAQLYKALKKQKSK